MTWVAGACKGCDFRLPHVILTVWHKDGTVFDFAMCGECLCDWLQDMVLGERSHNPVVEAKWRTL